MRKRVSKQDVNASKDKASRVHNTYLETLYRLSAVSFGIVAVENLLPLHVFQFVACFFFGFLFCVIAEHEAFRGRVDRSEFYRCITGDIIGLATVGLLEFAFMSALSEDWSASITAMLCLLAMGALRGALSRYHKAPVRGGVVEVAVTAAFANGLFDVATTSTAHVGAHTMIGLIAVLFGMWALVEATRKWKQGSEYLGTIAADVVTTIFNGLFVLALSSLVDLHWDDALGFGIAALWVGLLIKILSAFVPRINDRMAHIG